MLIPKLILTGYLTLVTPLQSPLGDADNLHTPLEARSGSYNALKEMTKGVARGELNKALLQALDASSRCNIDEDCRLVAQAIVYEARGEPRLGRMAVAKVVINRVKDKRFPDSVEGVLSQPYQFSYRRDMHKQAVPTKEDWEKAYIDAYTVLNGEAPLDMEGVLWYHTKTVKPEWRKSLTKANTIGNHYFYK